MAENKAWRIVLVGTFAKGYLVDIAFAVVKKAAEKLVRNVDSDILVWKKDEKDFNVHGVFKKESKNNTEKVDWDPGCKVLPLFVCETMNDLRRAGVTCPYEFILERNDFFDNVQVKCEAGIRKRAENWHEAAHRLWARIKRLQTQSQSKTGVSFDAFKDWMSGVMRKYLFLDDTVHGSSGYIDHKAQAWWKKWLHPVTDDEERNTQWWMNRFSDGPASNDDPLASQKPLMKKLWPCYFEEGKLSLRKLSEVRKSEDELITLLKSVYHDSGESPLPKPKGDRARFVTPTGKINVLLIDDNANEVTFDNLESRDKGHDKHSAEWKLFRDTFTIHPMQITPENFANTELYLRELVRKGLSFDFALVDLCLGEESGQDLLGYHLIKKVSKLFPHTPIVVYSRYKDMGHIMRAFHCGAMWFLEKGEEWKLPRHLMSIVKTDSWRREWRAIQEFYPVEFVYNGKNQAFDDSFRHKQEWQYLTAKSLEFFPGKFIEVKKMGGGISTAVTFSVQKGLKLDGKPLQSPMIIKIDTAPNARMEFQRYFRYVRPYMANESGRIERPSLILDREHSAIVYTFAGRQDGAHVLDSMKEMLKKDIVFKASCDYEKYRKAFDMIFDEILPKIHHVTPAREFGGGENRHQEVFSRPEALDAKDSPEASFPNLQFGEVEGRFFFETYLVRYPYFGERTVTSFEMQPSFKVVKGEGNDDDPIALTDRSDNLLADDDLNGVKKYEFHDIIPNPDGSIDLEVYDLKDFRKPYLLSGPLATHVARFRRQMHPGSVLWVKELRSRNDNLREEMFRARIEVGIEENADKAVKNWVAYVRKYYSGKNVIESQAGKAYFKLVDEVLLFCRALYADEMQKDDSDIEDSEYNKYLNNKKSDGGKDVSSDGKVLFCVPEVKEFFKHIKKRFKCPIAICHGDLNYGNIMLESRKHPPKDEKPDVSQTITDAWLIDFARTRRDLIAHDFNVMFTDTFALLFDERLFDADKDVVQKKEKYETRLNDVLPRFIRDVMFAENSNPPDYLDGDARFEFVYKILRRIRKAALGSGISKEMYTLTTVLECLMALKLHLKKDMKNIRASAALFAVAKICFEQLCEDVELDLLSMDKDGKTNKQRQTQP